MPCFSVSMGASLPRTFHLTFGAAILYHGRILKIRARHGLWNDAGYNYESGQWVPIGDVRPASVPPKGGHITRHAPVHPLLSRRCARRCERSGPTVREFDHHDPSPALCITSGVFTSSEWSVLLKTANTSRKRALETAVIAARCSQLTKAPSRPFARTRVWPVSYGQPPPPAP